jgi:hypothetical protein
MAEIEPCTTQAKRLKHYSNGLVPDRHAPRLKGRGGRTLCGNYGDDEERANAKLARWSLRRITVADLPECKQCAKAKAKREREPGPGGEVAPDVRPTG